VLFACVCCLFFRRLIWCCEICFCCPVTSFVLVFVLVLVFLFAAQGRSSRALIFLAENSLLCWICSVRAPGFRHYSASIASPARSPGLCRSSFPLRDPSSHRLFRRFPSRGRSTAFSRFSACGRIPRSVSRSATGPFRLSRQARSFLLQNPGQIFPLCASKSGRCIQLLRFRFLSARAGTRPSSVSIAAASDSIFFGCAQQVLAPPAPGCCDSCARLIFFTAVVPLVPFIPVATVDVA
jgi:hypothetical protein